jgi:hypothetical protein
MAGRFLNLGRVGNFGADSVEIERTWRTCARALHDMEIDHGGFDVGVSQKRLDGADIGARLKEMRGKRMAHGVAGGPLGNGGLSDRLFELTLQRDFVEVMTGDAAGAWMRAECGGGKDVCRGK